MKHVIIGTAGHVDHGKTWLVKALTGIDTDRLQEEKRRGITIELGFAHLEFEDGTQAGIVDVPGHERFIKHMLAGAGGIDLAMLVVAADEGFMPQTVEHLEILGLLGIRQGLVVLTKLDAVGEDWLRLVKEEAAAKVAGTFLEGKPIVPVSACTGEGIPELKACLRGLIQAAGEKNLHAPFRLPVDRVFSVDGFGTVVTGTLISGCIRAGETAQLVPSGLTAKVRALQVHNKSVGTACAGQRVGVNLAGLKKGSVRRGDTVVMPGSAAVTRMLDVRLQCLGSARRTLRNGSQVHFYHGSGAAVARCVLLDRDELKPGESCYAQLRLAEPVSAPRGDRFVIRFFSPVETIGGGVVLEDTPGKHKRRDAQVLERLRIRENGSDTQQLVQALAEGASVPRSAVWLAEASGMEPALLERRLRELAGRGEAVEVLPGRFLSAAALDSVWDSCRQLLERYHREHPLQAGMKLAELRQKLFRAMDPSDADAVLAVLGREGNVKRMGDRCSLAGFTVRLTRRQAALREEILKRCLAGGIEGLSLEALWQGVPPKERDACKQVAEYLVSAGELVMAAPGLLYCREVCDGCLRQLVLWLEDHASITLAEYRDLLGISRRCALILLNYFDRKNITKKVGDLRIRGANFPGRLQ